MKKIFIIIPFMLIFATACEDYELTKSIFIPDKVNPELPAYSEWGYNTFGVLFDRKPFINDISGIPGKIINSEGETTFELIGHLGDNFYSDGNTNRIIFVLPDFMPEALSDLLLLNNVNIDLKNPEVKVFLDQNDGETELEILVGSLQFKRAQNLIVDKEESFIILSGTFQFQALMNGGPVSFSEGRFDIAFNQDNFYYY